jgi:pilin isopeptide linkage protein
MRIGGSNGNKKETMVVVTQKRRNDTNGAMKKDMSFAFVFIHNNDFKKLTALLLALLMSSLIPIFFGLAMASGSHTAVAGDVTLSVRQAFTDSGKDGMLRTTSSYGFADDTFHYRLTPKRTTYPMPTGSALSNYDFTITGSGEVSIGPIGFTSAGVYTYDIVHVTDSKPGYQYDLTIYTLEVLVDSSLAAVVIATKQNGEKAPDILFEHSYDADEGLLPSDPSVMVDPPVVKTVSGNPEKGAAFTFRLTPGNPANPMPAGSVGGVKTVTVTGSGQTDFGTWSYTAKGTYYYAISEDNTGESNYTYDTTVYMIIDTVTEENGQLVVARVVLNNANKQVTSLSFINTYTGGGPTPSPTPSGNPSATPTTRPSGNPGGGASPSARPGAGPKTGDESNAALYAVLFCAAGVAALLSVGYLIFDRRRGRVMK